MNTLFLVWDTLDWIIVANQLQDDMEPLAPGRQLVALEEQESVDVRLDLGLPRLFGDLSLHRPPEPLNVFGVYRPVLRVDEVRRVVDRAVDVVLPKRLNVEIAAHLSVKIVVPGAMFWTMISLRDAFLRL